MRVCLGILLLCVFCKGSLDTFFGWKKICSSISFVPLYLLKFEKISLESLELPDSLSNFSTKEKAEEVSLSLEDAPTLRYYDELAGCEVIIMTSGTHSEDTTRFLNINHVLYAQAREKTCLVHAICDEMVIERDENCPTQEDANSIEKWTVGNCIEPKLWRYQAVVKLMKKFLDTDSLNFDPPRLFFVIDTDIVFLNFDIKIQDLYQQISKSRSVDLYDPPVEIAVANDLPACTKPRFPINSGVWLLRVSDYTVDFCNSVVENFDAFHREFDSQGLYNAKHLKDQPVAIHELQKLGVPVDQIQKVCLDPVAKRNKVWVESPDGRAVVVRNILMNSFYGWPWWESSPMRFVQSWTWPHFIAHLAGMEGRREMALKSLCTELPQTQRHMTGICVESGANWEHYEHSLVAYLRKMHNENLKIGIHKQHARLFRYFYFKYYKWLCAVGLFFFVVINWSRIRRLLVFLRKGRPSC